MKILIVEDRESSFHLMKMFLEDYSEIVWAQTISEAEELIPGILEFDLIVMDACVPGDDVNTIPLMKKILAKGFDKPIIASSSNPYYRGDLMKVGATHGIDKSDVPKLVIEILDLG